MENTTQANTSGPVLFSTSQVSVSFEMIIPGVLSTRTTPLNGRVMMGQIGPDYFTLLTGVQGQAGPISVMRLKRSNFAPSVDLGALTWTTQFMSGDLPCLSTEVGLPAFATTSLSLTFWDASVFWAFMYTSTLPLVPSWVAAANGVIGTASDVNIGWNRLLSLYNAYPEAEFPMHMEDTH